MGHTIIFRIGHGFHTKAATDIGVGHPHLFGGQPKHFYQTGFLVPDPLTVDRKMQPLAIPFSKTAARLKRVNDHPVVVNAQLDVMGRPSKRHLSGRLLAEAPVKRQIVRRFSVHGVPPRIEIQMHRQRVIVDQNSLGGIPGLIYTVRDHHRDRFTDKPNPTLGQQRPHRSGAFGAIQIGHRCRSHIKRHPRSL